LREFKYQKGSETLSKGSLKGSKLENFGEEINLGTMDSEVYSGLPALYTH
jgi:hypothetical protein